MPQGMISQRHRGSSGDQTNLPRPSAHGDLMRGASERSSASLPLGKIDGAMMPPSQPHVYRCGCARCGPARRARRPAAARGHYSDARGREPRDRGRNGAAHRRNPAADRHGTVRCGLLTMWLAQARCFLLGSPRARLRTMKSMGWRSRSIRRSTASARGRCRRARDCSRHAICAAAVVPERFWPRLPAAGGSAKGVAGLKLSIAAHLLGVFCRSRPILARTAHSGTRPATSRRTSSRPYTRAPPSAWAATAARDRKTR